VHPDHVIDLLLLAVLCAFFGLALLFVKACERIVGPDTEAERLTTEAAEPDEVAA
jgi:hypothetical protein